MGISISITIRLSITISRLLLLIT